MLLPYPHLVAKYGVLPTGVLHVGAHTGEEAQWYADDGVPRVVWVEANPELVPTLERHVRPFGHEVINACCYSEPDVELTFHVTNNFQSSSVLELDRHLHWVKDVWVDHDITVTTTTIDRLHVEHDFSELDFLNMDIQGAELLALQGATEYLTNVRWLYLEVNQAYLYRDCALIGDLDQFLDDYTRVETLWTPHEWGDALWIRDDQ